MKVTLDYDFYKKNICLHIFLYTGKTVIYNGRKKVCIWIIIRLRMQYLRRLWSFDIIATDIFDLEKVEDIEKYF